MDKDFECELTYNGKKVAIYSMGDYVWRTYHAIIDFCNKADVLIIAHNFANTKKKLDLETSVAAYPYHYIIKKTANNQTDCQAIISKI